MSLRTTLLQLRPGVGVKLLCPLALITMLQHLLNDPEVRLALLVYAVGSLCRVPCMPRWLCVITCLRTPLLLLARLMTMARLHGIADSIWQQFLLNYALMCRNVIPWLRECMVPISVLTILRLLLREGPAPYIGLRSECRQRQLRALQLTRETIVINLLLWWTRHVFYGRCFGIPVRQWF